MGADLTLLRERARFIRTETVRLIEIAKSGHYTSVFSSAEIFSVLYYHTMRLNADPKWPDRDRLILSKGHCAVGLYPVLADKGYFPTAWLDNYARLGSPLGDHPDMKKVPGIDFSSGSLGHGLSIGLGMALGQKARHAQGHPLGRTFVLLGDGELNEGQIWEAAQSAPHLKAGNLVGIIDRNGMGLDGLTEETMRVEPLAEKWRAFNWDVHEVDGHDLQALVTLFDTLDTTSDRPQMIVAHTIKGKGIQWMENSRVWHLGYLAGEDAQRAVADIEAYEW